MIFLLLSMTIFISMFHNNFIILLETNEIIENAKHLFVQGNTFSIIESMNKTCP